jgi:hypothetical protein
MNQNISDLIDRIKALEEELEKEFEKGRAEFTFIIENKRIRFAEEMIQVHKRLKTGLVRYIIGARPLNILTAPIIYAGFIPFLFLDLFVTLYQAICFPVYGIPKVCRADYLIFDREELPYLNSIEKFNCFYCSYANGLASYAREIGARTEQYWCPIKHARRIRDAHRHYSRFFEFGDAESFAKGLERLRKEIERNEVK